LLGSLTGDIVARSTPLAPEHAEIDCVASILADAIPRASYQADRLPANAIPRRHTVQFVIGGPLAPGSTAGQSLQTSSGNGREIAVEIES